VERDTAAKKLDDVVFPNVQPPPMATQLQNLGGASAIVVGAFCDAASSAVCFAPWFWCCLPVTAFAGQPANFITLAARLTARLTAL